MERFTLRASDNSAAVKCNVYASDCFVMTFELVLEFESIACSTVELDTGVSCDCKGLPICGEGMVRNGTVEKVVDFWSSHCG